MLPIDINWPRRIIRARNAPNQIEHHRGQFLAMLQSMGQVGPVRPRRVGAPIRRVERMNILQRCFSCLFCVPE